MLFLCFTGRKDRKRRQTLPSSNGGVSFPEIDAGLLCPGGKKQPSALDIGNCLIQKKRWKLNCRINGRTCYYINVCTSSNSCSVQHLRDNIYCCEYICASSGQQVQV